VSPSATNPVAARYAQLALPTAAWVIPNRYDKYTLGRTRRLDSFTKFAVGSAWQQDYPDEAEQYYFQACNADPGTRRRQSISRGSGNSAKSSPASPSHTTLAGVTSCARSPKQRAVSMDGAVQAGQSGSGS
jgi:hypothetical protein